MRTRPKRRYLDGKLAGGLAFAALAAGALLLVNPEAENAEKVTAALELNAAEQPAAQPVPGPNAPGAPRTSDRVLSAVPFNRGGDEVNEFGSGRGRASVQGLPSTPRPKSKMDFLVAPIFDPGSRTAEKAGSAPSPRPTAELERFNTERYDHIAENPFVPVAEDPRSTFSVDVDTAAYALTRRHLREGRRPPPGAVRIEELVNYFSYNYPEPRSGEPFSVTTELSNAPWAPKHHLLRIGIKGKHVAPATRPSANLVFLVDVSSSMNSPDKLPLLKQGFEMLVRQLDEGDRVSIVVYAGASGLVLPPTPGNEKRKILDALERLRAGGSTNGGEGIRLAYQQARSQFAADRTNRVVLATDGDFNVGTTNQSELIGLIELQAKTGVFLSVLGFGTGNYNDSTLEKLADKGNGNYAYIDSSAEAHKVLVEQAQGTLITIAKDVKIQIEMNPSQVEAFRLIGYENRVLDHHEFQDDTKDAGEIGVDHTVTALYEIVPKGGKVPGAASGSRLRYQKPAKPTLAARSGELCTVKLRYKSPQGNDSREMEHQVQSQAEPFSSASSDHQFAAVVASFGMLLRGSQYRGSSSFASVQQIAAQNAGGDSLRQELVELAQLAQGLSR
jgi:Ca-activated chloride channel family protein